MPNMDPSNGGMNSSGDDERVTNEEAAQSLIDARSQTLAEGKRVATLFKNAGLLPDSRARMAIVKNDNLSAAYEVDGWFIGWTDLDVSTLTNEELLAGVYSGLLLAEDGNIMHLVCGGIAPGGEGEPANILETRSFNILGDDPTDEEPRIVLLNAEEGEYAGSALSTAYDPLETERKIQEAIQFLESLMVNSGR